ncbi:MAG: hypothetical protein V7K41_01855, partial [Nostoc sp.]|uniref:hypothetical protein n=1 Tax=Nostoc sp. TaxID=1180 RepID=UPI002FF7AC2C
MIQTYSEFLFFVLPLLVSPKGQTVMQIMCQNIRPLAKKFCGILEGLTNCQKVNKHSEYHSYKHQQLSGNA